MIQITFIDTIDETLLTDEVKFEKEIFSKLSAALQRGKPLLSSVAASGSPVMGTALVSVLINVVTPQAEQIEEE